MLELDVSADDLYLGQTQIVPSSAALAFFGDTLDGMYYTGQSYESCTFSYVGTLSGSALTDISAYDDTGYLHYNPNYDFLIYHCPIVPSNDTSATFTVKIQPTGFSFSSLNYLDISCGISFATSTGNMYGNGFNTWDYSVDSIDYTANSLLRYQNGSYGGIQLGLGDIHSGWGGLYFSPINIHLSNADSFTLSSGNVTFHYVYAITNVSAAEGGGVYFYITTPTLSTDWVLDLPENDDDDGLLETIKNTVTGIASAVVDLASNIANAIKSALRDLFVPDEDDLTDFKADLDDLLEDTFGAAYTANTLLQDAVDGISGVSMADSSIYFPGIYFRNYTIVAAQNVPIKPDGMGYLFDTLATVIDIVCTISVINMLRNRFEKGVLENEG